MTEIKNDCQSQNFMSSSHDISRQSSRSHEERWQTSPNPV